MIIGVYYICSTFVILLTFAMPSSIFLIGIRVMLSCCHRYQDRSQSMVYWGHWLVVWARLCAFLACYFILFVYFCSFVCLHLFTGASDPLTTHKRAIQEGQHSQVARLVRIYWNLFENVVQIHSNSFQSVQGFMMVFRIFQETWLVWIIFYDCYSFPVQLR